MKLSQLFKKTYLLKYDVIGKDVNYKFITKNNSLYIYFQGSRGDTDWKANFHFWKKPYKDMNIKYSVHSGFLKCWKQIEDLVIAKITEKNRKGNFKWKNITICGYSHGGALAAFCHECVWYWRPDLRKQGLVGYGFEAPRIFHGKLHPALAERWQTFNVIRNNTDLVTHVPPALFGFRHVGRVIDIEGNYKLSKIKTLSPEDPIAYWFVPKCIKYHYPQCVYDGLLKEEETKSN